MQLTDPYQGPITAISHRLYRPLFVALIFRVVFPSKSIIGNHGMESAEKRQYLIEFRTCMTFWVSSEGLLGYD